MIVYFSVLILICLICYFDKKGDGKRPLIISILLIYLMITLQEGWGGDTGYYAAASEWYSGSGYSIKELNEGYDGDRHGELGYKIMFTHLPSYRVITFICAGVLCLSVYILLHNFVPRKYWFLFFIFMFIDRYMLMGDISALPRNGLAAALFLIALFFLSKKKKLIYLAIIIFAAFFHKSILVFIPLVFVPSHPLKIQPAIGLLSMGLLAIFSAIAPKSWSMIVSTILSESSYLDTYSHYVDESDAHYDLTLLVPFIIFWGYVLLSMLQQKGLNERDSFFLNVAFLTIVFRLLPGLGLSDRLFFYMDYCLFAGMLIAIDKYKIPKGKIISDNVLIIIISLVFVYGRWFLEYSRTPHFVQAWSTYTPIF